MLTELRKQSFFVTGTDTGVGKTLFCAQLLAAAARAQRRCTGMKPVASGAEHGPQGLRNDDAMALLQASSVKAPYEQVNPYCFEPAVAPHLAAAEINVSIDLSHIEACARGLAEHCDLMIVEGVGGWRAPLGQGITVADLAQRLNLPVILVVGVRLGCLNHALLTIESINRSGLPFAGWVASQIEPSMARIDENIAALCDLLGQSPLCMLPWKPTQALLRTRMDAVVEALGARQ